MMGHVCEGLCGPVEGEKIPGKGGEDASSKYRIWAEGLGSSSGSTIFCQMTLSKARDLSEPDFSSMQWGG